MKIKIIKPDGRDLDYTYLNECDNGFAVPIPAGGLEDPKPSSPNRVDVGPAIILKEQFQFL